MSFSLPDLLYQKEELVPYISAKTIEVHYNGHHATYVKNLNNLIEGKDFVGKSLEEIILIAKSDGLTDIFNNAAQAWNHAFFWKSISPKGGGAPFGYLEKKISDNFGSYGQFYTEIKKISTSHFGSGWAWLISDKDGKLSVKSTHNAETPITNKNEIPLITIDLWEHSYYLDYMNKRLDYISNFLEHLINWDFAEKNFSTIYEK